MWTLRCIVVLTLLAVLLPGAATAFHDRGVGKCQSCHTMHVSQDGRPGFHWTRTGNPYLLLYGNASDTCMRCHYFRGQISNGTGHGPGGDFYWLTRTFTWTTPWGTTETSSGASHGHNVASGVFNIPVDPVLATAPGGDFLSSRMGCTACHDPHGNDNFRMLYDSTLGPIYEGGSRFTFTADAPEARGNSEITKVGSGGNETNSQHTIYKSGMSAWCANCHPAMHNGNSLQFQHPVDIALTNDTAARYNAYVSSDDLNGGNAATSYLGLVPFEAVDIDLNTADPANATFGPKGTDRVMCLTCHRSHASPFADAGRWDFSATFLASGSHPQTGDGGASAQDVANRYYGYTFAANQRSLCNKCHAKDYGDAPHLP